MTRIKYLTNVHGKVCVPNAIRRRISGRYLALLPNWLSMKILIFQVSIKFQGIYHTASSSNLLLIKKQMFGH